MASTTHSWPATLRLHQFLSLTKPRVVSRIIFTAVIGMFLATNRHDLRRRTRLDLEKRNAELPS